MEAERAQSYMNQSDSPCLSVSDLYHLYCVSSIVDALTLSMAAGRSMCAACSTEVIFMPVTVTICLHRLLLVKQGGCLMCFDGGRGPGAS